MTHRTIPENVNHLEPNEVFVFGSNLAGVHWAGAAAFARIYLGAKMGTGTGRMGRCYAIPTKDEEIQTLPIDRIRPHVEEFIEYAKNNSDLIFLVTNIGCGLAGYTPAEIAPLFKEAIAVDNIHLSKEFWKELLI